MLRKFLLIVLAVTLLVTFGTAIGCGNSVAGKYVDQADSSNYIILKSDGTCTNVVWGMSDEGTWEVTGDRLKVYLGGFVITGTIEGNRITTPEGQVLIKK